MGKFRYLVVLLGCVMAVMCVAVPVVCSAQVPSDYAFPNQADDLYVVGAQLDRVAETVTWYQGLPGDYDQNGEVNLADLSALVRHFGESNPEGWPLESIQSVLDGDGNKEINLADITTIAINFGLAYDTFELFTTSPPFVRGGGIMEVSHSASIGNPLEVRLKYEAHLFIGPSPVFYISPAYQTGFIGTETFVYEVTPHPARLANRTYGLTWDPDTETLSWLRNIPGDGDQNGEVNLADITAIAIHFGAWGAPGSPAWHADYDGNGEVNMADIPTIKYNYGASLDGFLFYSTFNPEDLPALVSYPVLTPISFGEITGESGEYLWLRPYFGDPSNPVNVGPPSEIIQVP